MKNKIRKLTTNIILIYENNKYCKLKNTQIDNYYKSKGKILYI